MSLGESGYDKDRFDRSRRGRLVGVHRSATKRRGPWRTLLIFLVTTLVLFGIGVAVIELNRPSSEPVTLPVETAEPILTDPTQIDPASGVTISVLDASGGSGQAAFDTLQAAGWPMLGILDADPAETTTIFYANDSLAPIARGIAAALGVGEIQLEESELSGSPITVVVGADAVPEG